MDKYHNLSTFRWRECQKLKTVLSFFYKYIK